MDQENIYNSGLNRRDWVSLRDALWKLIHAEDPSTISIPDVPLHPDNTSLQPTNLPVGVLALPSGVVRARIVVEVPERNP